MVEAGVSESKSELSEPMACRKSKAAGKQLHLKVTSMTKISSNVKFGIRTSKRLLQKMGTGQTTGNVRGRGEVWAEVRKERAMTKPW